MRREALGHRTKWWQISSLHSGRGLREITNWCCIDLQPAGGVKAPENPNPTGCNLLAKLEEGLTGRRQKQERSRAVECYWEAQGKHPPSVSPCFKGSLLWKSEIISPSTKHISSSLALSLAPQCPSNSPSASALGFLLVLCVLWSSGLQRNKRVMGLIHLKTVTEKTLSTHRSENRGLWRENSAAAAHSFVDTWVFKC